MRYEKYDSENEADLSVVKKKEKDEDNNLTTLEKTYISLSWKGNRSKIIRNVMPNVFR